jgi:hypothetical protein
MSSQFSPKTEEIYQSDNSEGLLKRKSFAERTAKSDKKRIERETIQGAARLSRVPTETLIKRKGELIRDIEVYDRILRDPYENWPGVNQERGRLVDELRPILYELARREKLAMERKKQPKSVGQEILGNREEDDDWSRWLI